TEVPVWLDRLVQRGLSVRPAERFRGMDELLDYLTEKPRPPLAGRRLALAGGLTLALAAAAFAVYDVLAARPPPPPVLQGMCEAPDLGWDEARRAALARALGERPGGQVFAGPALAAIDGRAHEIRDMYQETCLNGR